MMILERAAVTYPERAQRYREFRDSTFGPTAGGGSVIAETPEAGKRPPLNELELQARWFAGELGREFVSTEGEPVRIVQFGHWNRGAGPDFTEAAVRVGKEERCGAIEIDLTARSWESHGHMDNPAFNGVVLHVFGGESLGNGAVNGHGGGGGGTRFFTRTENDRNVAQLALNLEAINRRQPANLEFPAARLGRCSFPLKDMDTLALNKLIEGAAQHRLARKAERLGAISTAHGWEQALYLGLAEALGYRRNKLPMAILGQRVPLKELQARKPIHREALLFGVAGFLEHENYKAADDDAKRYLKGLWDHWWKDQSAWSVEPEQALQWTFSGVRPVNHPQRRVAGLGLVVEHWRGLNQVLDRARRNPEQPAWLTALVELFAEAGHFFWDWHYSLKSKRAARRNALIGESRLHDMLGNIIFPLLIRDDDRHWNVYRELRASVESEPERRAVLRLMGDRPDRKKFQKAFYQQQGLLQIFEDFCLRDHSECEQCVFPEQLLKWTGEG